MEIRISSVGQQNMTGTCVSVLNCSFSSHTDAYVLNQTSRTIALFQDAYHTPADGLDMVATNWKCVLVVLDSRTRPVLVYSC